MPRGSWCCGYGSGSSGRPGCPGSRRADAAVGGLSSSATSIFFGLVPHAVAVHFVTVSLVLRLLFFALLLWVVVEGIRRQGVEGWLVLPARRAAGDRAFRPNSGFSISG